MPQRNSLTINSPLDVERNYQNTLAAQYSNQAAQQNIQQNQLQLNQMDQQDRDRQAIIGAWQNANGDRNVFLQNLQKVAPHLVQDAQQKMAMSDIELQKSRLEGATKLIDATAQRVGALKAIAPEQRPLAWGAVRQQLLQMGHSQQELPEQYPGDQWVDMTLQQGMDAKAQVEAAQKKSELQQKITHETNEEALTKRGQDITMRGQNMTDARAREAQATNNDLKNLKAQELGMQIAQQQSANQGAAASYDRAIQSIDRLKNHPGLSSAVGISFAKLATPGMTVPGTDRADFEAQLDSLKAQTFLPMVQSLRGMGALSDAEGKKLTDAIGTLSTNQSEKAFKESLDRIKADLEAAKARVPNFGAQQPAPQAPPPQPQGHPVYVNGKLVGYTTDGKTMTPAN